uniref:Putative ovule protein n=1 Tax=Solanum chacoense TaxID=4108 RepID=A0A0V0HI69_SOLCH
MQAICCGSINLAITAFNHSSSTLENNLYILPIRLIGLKSLNSLAPFFFGMRVMKVALRLLSNLLCSWKF